MTQVLHAQSTNTLLHADKPAGERNTIFTLARLTDESGNVLVDQAGNVLVAWGQTFVLVLHAEATSTMLHAEDS